MAAVKTTSIQTSINSAYLQDRAITCADGADWGVMEPFLQDTALGNEREQKIGGPLWIDAIVGSTEPGWRWGELDSLESGMELSSTPISLTQDLVKSASATTLLTYAVVQRDLLLGPSEPAWL